MEIDGISPVDMNMLAQRSLADAATQPRNLSKINRASEDFEAMFMTQMLSPMWEGIEPDETFGGGSGEQVFRTFMMQEYGRLAAKSGTLGISDDVQRAMLEFQAGRQKQ